MTIPLLLLRRKKITVQLTYVGKRSEITVLNKIIMPLD